MPLLGGQNGGSKSAAAAMGCVGGGGGEWDTERSSISTNSSATSNSLSTNFASNSANKLTKFGKRIRDSCRNLRVSKSGRKHFSIDSYTTDQLPNESVRSKVYVAMDFTRESGGRVLDNPKDIKACDKAGAGSTSLLAASQVAAACKDGYVPFRRRVAKAASEKLTETQANIHRRQPWYHAGLVRERANKILQAHANTDGVFLVRESSVTGAYVISYTYDGKVSQRQVFPVSNEDGVTYTLDEGQTKFYDLLQLVEYYQLNPGPLPTRLVHYIVSREAAETEEQNNSAVNGGSGNTQEGANSNGVANALTHNGGSGSTISTSTSANNVMNGNSNGGGSSHSCNGGVGSDQHSMEDGESHQRGEKEKPRRRNISALSSSGGSNGGEDIDELDDAQSMEYSAGGCLTASLNGDSGDVIIVGDGTATTNGEAMLKLGRECNGNDVDSNGCCPPPPTSAVINGGGTGHHLDSRDSLESDKMVASSASSEQESNMSQDGGSDTEGLNRDQKG